MIAKHILVVTALKKERRALEAALGELAERVELARLGMGPEQAERRLRELLERRRPDALLLFGSAGWLGDRENFAAGRAFLIERAVAAGDGVERESPSAAAPGETLSSAAANEALLELARQIANLPLAVAATVDRGVADSEARRRLARSTGAELVDMETHTVYRLANERGVPAIALRVVTDCAGAAALAEYKQNVAEALRQGAEQAARTVRRLLGATEGGAPR